MSEESAISQKMRDAVGVESETNTFVVTEDAIAKFAESIEDPSPIFNDEQAARSSRYGGIVAPPTFLRSCYPGKPRVLVKIPYQTSVDGGSDWEYFEPVRAGDTIGVTQRISALQERKGRLGDMLFVTRELRFVNQHGDLVALERNTGIHYQPPEALPGPDRYLGAGDRRERPVGTLPEQVYFEDVGEGLALPTLEKNPTTRQLVKYAAASIEYPEIHYDQGHARAAGLPDVIIQGSLKHAFLGHLVTGWMGERGTLKKLNVQYRGMDVPGRPVYCKGVVTRKYSESGENIVECDVWMENKEGVKTTLGSAVVALPLRSVQEPG